MNIPKVEFSVAPIDKIFSLIHHFLNPAKGDWDWSNAIYWNYPELKNKLQNIKDEIPDPCLAGRQGSQE